MPRQFFPKENGLVVGQWSPVRETRPKMAEEKFVYVGLQVNLMVQPVSQSIPEKICIFSIFHKSVHHRKHSISVSREEKIVAGRIAVVPEVNTFYLSCTFL